MFNYGFPPEWSTMKKLIWLKRFASSGASWVWQLITGTAPLTLLDAVAHPIKSLTQYGLCVQDGTPTPSAPVDILCNNGALKFGKPLTLDPARYYAYIGTGNYWSYSTDSYSIVIPVTVGKKYRITADPITPVDGGAGNTILRWGFVDTIYDNWKQADALPSTRNVRIYDCVRSTPQETQSVEVTATHPYMIVQMGSVAFASNIANGRVGVAVQEIYTDGTPEVLTVSGKNIFDIDTVGVVQGTIGNITGTESDSNYRVRTGFVSVKPNTTYTASAVIRGYTASSSNGLYLFEFSTAEQSGFIQSSGWQSPTGYTFTTGATTNYIRFVFAISSTTAITPSAVSNIQLELGSTATAYEPYTAQTASVPMLLGVGDYKDTAEFIQGVKTGKVGVKVFDGTENWTAYQTSSVVAVLQNATSAWGAVAGAGGYCTHLTVLQAGETTFAGSCRFATDFNIYEYKTAFGVENLAGLKAYLAAQYANGTPVIVVYPLATETTEQGAPHALHTTRGTNVVDVTANVSPVELAVEYAKEAS